MEFIKLILDWISQNPGITYGSIGTICTTIMTITNTLQNLLKFLKDLGEMIICLCKFIKKCFCNFLNYFNKKYTIVYKTRPQGQQLLEMLKTIQDQIYIRNEPNYDVYNFIDNFTSGNNANGLQFYEECLINVKSDKKLYNKLNEVYKLLFKNGLKTNYKTIQTELEQPLEEAIKILNEYEHYAYIYEKNIIH